MSGSQASAVWTKQQDAKIQESEGADKAANSATVAGGKGDAVATVLVADNLTKKNHSSWR